MALTLRPPTTSDAGALADLLARNRRYFQTTEPIRSDEYYTAPFQERLILDAERARSTGTSNMYLIEVDEELVGRAYLNSIIRGAFQSASVAYAVDQDHTGHGIATGALSGLIRLAFTELNLHRLQGETLVDNHASQHVLARCGFIHYGTVPSYLRIQGRWQTHELYHLTNDHWSE